MNTIKKINNVVRVLLLFGLANGSAAAGTVSFSSPGFVNYSYSAANNNALTPDVNVSSNIVVDSYAPFGSGSNVTGITKNDANPGTVTWHFQTGPGLMFGAVDLQIGTGCFPAGTIIGEYSTDGVTFTQWASNVNNIDTNLTASKIAWRATNLYVRFTLIGTGLGNQVLTWGGDTGARPFVLNGSVFSSSAPVAVSFNSAGLINYSYSASGNNPLTSDANRSSNVVVGGYTIFSPTSGVTGITTNDTNPGYVYWHFKAGPGLVFGNDVNLNIGSGVVDGSISGDYSTDGVTFTPWDTNSGNADKLFDLASNVAEGAKDLYVRFLMNGTGMGSQVLTWGGGLSERAFILNGSVVNEPVSGFASWAANLAFGLAVGDQGANSDPENDGVNNLLEYALSGNPSLSDLSIVPQLFVTSTTFEFNYSRLDLSLSDTVQTFQYGSDLSGWTSILVPTELGTSVVGNATVTITDPGGAIDSVNVTIPKSISTSGKLFGRLRVVKQ